MLRKFMGSIAVITALVVAAPAPLAMASYRSQIESYVRKRPAQARMVVLAMKKAGWGHRTKAQQGRLAQGVRVVAGESGFQTAARTGSCSGWFQIWKGSGYGRFTAKEMRNARIRNHYTLSETTRVYGKLKSGGKGWYYKTRVYFRPYVGQPRINNPIFNAEVALRKYRAHGWRPWVVANKLGYR
jgi:hypothetical protein